MADYTPDSFKRCLFNPLAKDLAKRYPESRCDEKVLRYVLCLYDPKSPLIKDCRNIKTRKQEAARLAGFNLSTDSEFLDDLFAFKNKEAVTATINFLKEHVHNRIWTMIVSHEQTFYEYNERLMKPVDDGSSTISKPVYDEDDDEVFEESTSSTKEKDVMATIAMKSKLIKDLKEIHANLNEYYKEMFEDDDLRDKVVSNKFTPEAYARNV